MQQQANEIRMSVRDTFGLSDVDARYGITGLTDIGDPYVPVAHPDYVFRSGPLKDLLEFLERPNGDALFITGPTGSGKTSLVMETAARLHWPVQSLTMTGRTEFAELRGQFVLCSREPGQPPQTLFRYGPLAKAMKRGHILLINELDLADPAELSGLNDVLEGRPLVITENGGEIIKPHPRFRVIATGNSAGAGDSSGLYQGVQTQNLAAMDRYRMTVVDYPDAEVERMILKKAVPGLSDSVIEIMLNVAHKVRKSFIGEDGSGTLSLTLSTRTLVRWANLTVRAKAMGSSSSALRYAFDRALVYRARPEEREALVSYLRLNSAVDI